MSAQSDVGRAHGSKDILGAPRHSTLRDRTARTPRSHSWSDRGGTLADVVARRPNGAPVTHKLLSGSPERYRDAAIAAIRELLGIDTDEPHPADRIEVGQVHTTVTINTPLQRGDGSRVQLDGADKTEMNAGDVFVIETPGGGGYGTPA